jgi:hypothetical protein
MNKTFGSLASLALLSVMMIGAAPARAEDQDALVRQGVELRRQGREQEALEVFQRAAAIKKTPRVMAQVAFAEQALGQWVKAERDLKLALQAKSDPWIVKNRATIDEAMNAIAGHLGSLEVWGTPAGAEVLVDGEVVGTLPSSGAIRLPRGDVSVTVRHAGYAEVTRTVQIGRGALTRENVDLHAQASPAPVAPLALEARPGNAAEGSPLVATERAEPGSSGEPAGADRPIYKRWWFWTVIAAAAVGAGTTAYLVTRPAKTSMTCDPGVANCTTWGSP